MLCYTIPNYLDKSFDKIYRCTCFASMIYFILLREIHEFNNATSNENF